jgi:hypothetical protein
MVRVLFAFLITTSVCAQRFNSSETKLYLLDKSIMTKTRVTETGIQSFPGVVVVKSNNRRLIQTLLDEKNWAGEELDAFELDVRALFIIPVDGVEEKKIAISRTAISNGVKTIRVSPKSKIYKAVKRLSPRRLGW